MKTLSKPRKPLKKVWITNSASYPFSYNYSAGTRNGSATVEEFLVWIKKSIPANAKNVRLGLYSDDDYDMDGNMISSFPKLELTWEEKIDNPIYEKQMKRYEKKLIKWKKEQ